MCRRVLVLTLLVVFGFIAGTVIAQIRTPLGSDWFNDVPDDHWANEAIGWAAVHGMTAGVGEGRFDPDGTPSRGEIVTFLHRFHNLLDTDRPMPQLRAYEELCDDWVCLVSREWSKDFVLELENQHIVGELNIVFEAKEPCRILHIDIYQHRAQGDRVDPSGFYVPSPPHGWKSGANAGDIIRIDGFAIWEAAAFLTWVSSCVK